MIQKTVGASFVVALIGVAYWEFGGFIADRVLPWLRSKLKLDKGGESE